MPQNNNIALVGKNALGFYVPLAIDSKGALITTAEAADGGTPVIASSGTVAAATAAASLPGAAGKTTYITGFTATAGGATAGANVSVTISGLAGGGTPDYIYTAPTGAAVPGPVLNVTFNPPLAASGPNTAIVVTMPTLGAGNLAAAVTATGFQL